MAEEKFLLSHRPRSFGAESCQRQVLESSGTAEKTNGLDDWGHIQQKACPWVERPFIFVDGSNQVTTRQGSPIPDWGT